MLEEDDSWAMLLLKKESQAVETAFFNASSAIALHSAVMNTYGFGLEAEDSIIFLVSGISDSGSGSG